MRDNKFVFFIMSTIVVMIILSAGHIVKNGVKTYSLSEITNHSPEECNVIRSGTNSRNRQKVPVSTFTQNFGLLKFRPLKATSGNAQIQYICYDKSGEILFTFIDAGADNAYYITPGAFNGGSDMYQHLYQAV